MKPRANKSSIPVGKTLSKQAVTGDQGIAFIHGVVSRTGLMWVENKGAADVGIDGYIELSDLASGQAYNRRISVQSKGGISYFLSEDEETFEFRCKEQDLDYWLSGDAPVVLVVSRNGTEGYWKSIKEYFVDPSVRATRKIIFDKRKDVFNESSCRNLVNLKHLAPGTYLAPTPKVERLSSNLVPVSLQFDQIYVARTNVRFQRDFDEMVEGIWRPKAWVVKDGLVISCYDLNHYSFKAVVEAGTVERWPVTTVSESTDIRNRLTVLLNRLLRSCLGPFGISWYSKENLYYFLGSESESGDLSRVFSYRSFKDRTSREVVQNYSNNPRFPCWKHSAAQLFFIAFGDEWYLTVVPSHFFTKDGFEIIGDHAERLKKIKSLEHNLAVRGQTKMWADILEYSQASLGQNDWLIRFKSEVSVDVGVGIDDASWLPSQSVPSEATSSDLTDVQESLGGLFV